MLIPSIDLQGGRIVQLVQGERLAVSSDDFDGWIRRFERFPKVQLIDLDAAKNAGDNLAIVTSICRRLPCRVGGGIRTVTRAASAIDAASTLFPNVVIMVCTSLVGAPQGTLLAAL